MKKATFAMFAMLMVVVMATGCNNHPSSSGGSDLHNNNDNVNQNTNNNVNNNQQVDEGFKVVTGSYGMIALRSSEEGGQDDFGPGAESVDYTFYFTAPGVAVVAATDDIDLWSEENVEVWPVIDVAAFKTVIRTYFHIESPSFMSEGDLKVALAAFACSDAVDRPDLAPVGCPEYFVPSNEFLYWDYAAEFTWKVYDYEDIGIVFILKE